jgi:hypothetical protein
MFNTLTQADYDKAIKLVGPRGYTFDEAIQCGLDGRSGTGMALPDEESYYLWQEWYDKLIDVRHSHPPGAKHTTDLDYTKVDTSKLPADLDDFCVSTPSARRGTFPGSDCHREALARSVARWRR